ncbi:hypothetical protein V6N13_018135 [Hibiscus sabdariffa]
MYSLTYPSFPNSGIRAPGCTSLHISCVIKMEGSVTHDGDMFKLTEDNFSYWKLMMEDHLYCKDLYEPITFQTMPEGKIERECELLNRKAVPMIHKYIDKSLFEHVSTYTNDYKLWSKLESMIQKKIPRNKARLVRRLVKLEYNDDQSMIEHLNNFKGLVNQLNLPSGED